MGSAAWYMTCVVACSVPIAVYRCTMLYILLGFGRSVVGVRKRTLWYYERSVGWRRYMPLVTCMSVYTHAGSVV
jgi:hypothetical protein